MIAYPVGWSVSSTSLSFFQAKSILLIHRTGASAFIGLGAYTYYTGQQGLKERAHIIAKQGGMGGLRWRLGGIALLSSTFVGMGLYRLVN